MLYFSMISIFETWSEEKKATFAGQKLASNKWEIAQISNLRKHPTHRNPFLAYLKTREAQIERENKWLSTIGEW